MTDDLTPIKAGGWGLFTQLNGPNTEWSYLGCHDLDDLEQDLGDITLEFCEHPTRANKYIPVAAIQGEPSAATTTVTANIAKTQGLMAKATEASCNIPFYIGEMGCGKRNYFPNWDSQVHVLYPTTIISKGMQNVVKKAPGDATVSTRSYGLSSPDWLEIFDVSVEELQIGETTPLLDITFCNDLKCADVCGQAEALCESGVVAGEAPSGSPTAQADIWSTGDEGAIWTVRNPGPFIDGNDPISIVCFDIDKDTTRYLAANGTNSGAGPMQVAYRDGLTGSWTRVDVGAVTSQVAMSSGSLFALDSGNIWLVTDGGYIYFSDDGGVTWDTQSAADVTSEDLYYIHGSDSDNLFAVGDNDTILRTTSGGEAWQAATATGGGNTLQTVNVLSRYKAWVGDDDDNLYFTTDAATTWTARTFTGGATGGAIYDVAFVNDLVGWMVHVTAAGAAVLLRTVNGGFNWRLEASYASSSLVALSVCGNNLAYAVGTSSTSGPLIVRAKNT